MNLPIYTWTESLVARLRELAEDGLSSGAIASRLNAEFSINVTRNAVIGKCRRMKIALGAARVKRTPALVTQSIKPVKPRKPAFAFGSAQKPKPIRREAMSEVFACEPIPLELPLWQLEKHHCRWVIEKRGFDDESLFCGDTVLPGHSYCPHHFARVFTKPPKEERRSKGFVPEYEREAA